MVAKGGQDEHQAPLVQVPHRVQLLGKISRKIIWDRVQLILERSVGRISVTVSGDWKDDD